MRAADVTIHRRDSNHTRRYLAGAEWKMMRADRLGSVIYEQYGGEPPDGLASPYDRATRTEGRHQRVWFKLSKELQSIRAARIKQSQQHAPSPQPPQTKPAGEPAGQPAAPKSTPAQDTIKRGWAHPKNGRHDRQARQHTMQERNEVRWEAKKGAPPWMTIRHYRGKLVRDHARTPRPANLAQIGLNPTHAPVVGLRQPRRTSA